MSRLSISTLPHLPWGDLGGVNCFLVLRVVFKRPHGDKSYVKVGFLTLVLYLLFFFLPPLGPFTCMFLFKISVIPALSLIPSIGCLSSSSVNLGDITLFVDIRTTPVI